MSQIVGHSMLDRVVSRLHRAERLHDVVVATSMRPEDDVIAEHAVALGAHVVRGDPLDVLARYSLAARESSAEVLVRVTSDCPFIDPGIVDQVVGLVLDSTQPIDYTSNTLEPRTFPRGLDVEAMTAEALFEADRLDDDAGTREHVTPFIRESGRYKCLGLTNGEDLSGIRWTVDTAEDLELARQMAAHFDGSVETTWLELLEAWRLRPEWHALNAHVEQKKVTPKNRR